MGRIILRDMKTSVDIDDHLFARVKAIADEKKLTFRAMVEAGLQFVIREHHKAMPSYVMPNAQFKGAKGFVAGASEASISLSIRDMNQALANPSQLRK
jgi:hypothetical protein